MALSANNFAFSLAPRTDACEDIVESISQFHSSINSALSITFLASHDIVRVLSTAALAVRTGNLLFDENGELFSQIEVFEWKVHLHSEFRPLEASEIELHFNILLIDFVLSEPVVQIFFVFIH